MIETPILSGCGATYKCKCCGHKRQVLSPHQWGWWYGADWCCSYHCMRELRRRDLAKPRRKLERELNGLPPPDKVRGSKISAKEFARMRELRDSGDSLAQIAVAFDRDYTAVRRIFKKWEDDGHAAAMVPDGA